MIGCGQLPNVQLTDGGPPATPELPTGVAGPPFGAAPLLCACRLSTSQNPIPCEIYVRIQVHLHAGVLQVADK